MKTKTKKQKKRKTKKKRKLVRKPRTKKKQKRQKTIRKRKTTRKNKKAITKKKREVIEISLGLIGLIILTLMAIQDPTLLGLNKITGSSTLEIHNQTGAWNTITDNNYLDSEALFTNTLGAKTAYHFNGSNVKIITQKRNDFGIMNVNVDGTDYEIDLYSEESVYGHEHNFNLAEGYHEMIISVSGNKNNLSTDYYIVIDEVILIESTEDETIFKIIEEAPEEETNKTQEINETILEAEDLDFGGLWFRAENNKYSNNVSLISNYHNDSLEYEFIGRNVYLLTEKRDDFGVANITIDDKSYLVDFYSENSIKPYLVSIKNLADTQHELRIKLTNLKNAQSTDNYIAIDALLQSKIGDLSDYETIDISNIKINEITDVLYQETQEQRIEITNQMQETITPPTFIKINEPVKWTKTVQVQQTTNNLKIELPKETVNLTIKKKDQYDNEELVGEENIKIIDENKETKQITEFVKEKEILIN